MFAWEAFELNDENSKRDERQVQEFGWNVFAELQVHMYHVLWTLIQYIHVVHVCICMYTCTRVCLLHVYKNALKIMMYMQKNEM
jgi:hypothetical protein